MVELVRLVYDLSNKGNYEEARILIDESNEDSRLKVILRLHLDLYNSKHIEVIDSAKNLFIRHKSSDQPVIYVFGSLVALISILYKIKDFDSIHQLLEDGEDMLKKIGSNYNKEFNIWIIWYHTIRGLVYWTTGELDNASLHLNAGLRLAKGIEDYYGATRQQINLSLIELYKAEYTKSFDALTEARNLLANCPTGEKLHITLLKQILANEAVLYNKIGDREKGLQTLLQLIPEDETEIDPVELSGLYYNIATLYGELRNYSATWQYLEKCRLLTEEIENVKILAAVYSLEANLVYERGDMAQSLKLYKQALKFAEKLDDQHRIALIYANMGLINTLRADFDQAITNFRNSLSITNTSKGILDPSLNSLSYYYLGYIDLMKCNDTDAEKQWLKVLEINETIAEPEKKSTILEALIHYYIEHNEPNKALNYMDELILLVKEYEHPTIINTFNLCKASLMVSEPQTDYTEVISILEQLVSIEVGFREEINFNIRLRAMFNLSHIYLTKLVETGDLSFFEKAVIIVDEIISFTQQQRLIPNVIDAKILKAKLKVIESDVDTAISIISTAMKETEEYDLTYHKELLKSEFHQLFTDKSVWNGELNPANIESRVKDSMILHFLRTKGGSKGAFPDF